MPYKDPEARRANQRARYRRNKVLHRDKRRKIERAYRYKQKLLHPDKVKAQAKKRYWSNRDKALADSARRRSKPEFKEAQKLRSRKWYQEHKEHARTLVKAYVEKDRDRWREYSRAHYQANRARYRELSKVWDETHPEQHRAIGHRATVNRRGRKKAAFVETVDPSVVFARDKGTCGVCRKRVDVESKWEIDHIIPISKGGAHAYANVQLTHRSCNRSKHAKIPTGQPTLFQVVANG